MSGLTWVLYAVIAAITAAAIKIVSERVKIKAIHLMVWLRIFAVLMLFPFILFLPAPSDPLFYLLVAVTAFIFVYSDLHAFGLAAKNGAGVVSRIEPLITVVVFFLWTAITPSLLSVYIESPLRTLGIFGALGGATYFALRLRRCAVSLETLRYMWKPLLVSAVGTVIAKTAIDLVDPLSGAFYYTWMQGIFMLCIYGVISKTPLLANRVPDFGMQSLFFTRNALVAGLCAAVFHVVHMIAKYHAYAATENPAYISVVLLTGPLWILLFYKATKRREDADILSGLGVVFCALLLIFATRL